MEEPLGPSTGEAAEPGAESAPAQTASGSAGGAGGGPDSSECPGPGWRQSPAPSSTARCSSREPRSQSLSPEGPLPAPTSPCFSLTPLLRGLHLSPAGLGQSKARVSLVRDGVPCGTGALRQPLRSPPPAIRPRVWMPGVAGRGSVGFHGAGQGSRAWASFPHSWPAVCYGHAPLQASGSSARCNGECEHR